jgi:hypothetical protein
MARSRFPKAHKEAHRKKREREKTINQRGKKREREIETYEN